MKLSGLKLEYGLLVGVLVASLAAVPRLAIFHINNQGDPFVFGFTNFLFTILVWIPIFKFLNFGNQQHRNKTMKQRVLSIFGAFLVGLIIMLPIATITDNYVLEKVGLNLKAEFFFFVTMYKTIPITGLVLLIKYAFDVQEEKKTISLENEKLKEISLRTELESLKQQINPHFLFNSLNTLKTMIAQQPADAEEFVVRLSSVYRHMLSSKGDDLIPLAQEMELCNNYIFLVKSRFLDNLIIEKDFNQNELQGKVPPYALLLLVENCIKHNMISRQFPLTITIRMVEAGLLEVQNNLQKKSSTEVSNGIGLNNLWQRYNYLTEKQVTIFQDEKIFSVKIPIL